MAPEKYWDFDEVKRFAYDVIQAITPEETPGIGDNVYGTFGPFGTITPKGDLQPGLADMEMGIPFSLSKIYETYDASALLFSVAGPPYRFLELALSTPTEKEIKKYVIGLRKKAMMGAPTTIKPSAKPTAGAPSLYAQFLGRVFDHFEQDRNYHEQVRRRDVIGAYETGRGLTDLERLIVRGHRDKLHNYIKSLQESGAISEETYGDFRNWWRDEMESVRTVEDGFNIGKNILHNKEVLSIG